MITTETQPATANYSAVVEADQSRMKIAGMMARLDALMECPCDDTEVVESIGGDIQTSRGIEGVDVLVLRCKVCGDIFSE